MDKNQEAMIKEQENMPYSALFLKQGDKLV